MKAKYTLRVDDETWESFKRVVSKDKTMNDAIIELIKKKILGAKRL